MTTLENIKKTLVAIYNEYDNIKVGIAGSYANGTQKNDSDIDIVIDGDSTRQDIAEYIKSLFNESVDVLWLELLLEDDIKMDNFLKEIGMSENKESLYKTVIKEVIWV